MDLDGEIEESMKYKTKYYTIKDHSRKDGKVFIVNSSPNGGVG